LILLTAKGFWPSVVRVVEESTECRRSAIEGSPHDLFESCAKPEIQQKQVLPQAVIFVHPPADSAVTSFKGNIKSSQDLNGAGFQ
jgi:hypothetical protein